MTEIWKEIPNTGGRYSISNQGRVMTNKTGRIRKLHRNVRSGNIQCSLYWCEDGKKVGSNISVAREIARAFLPSFKEEMIVRFKDGNSSNLQLSNLYMGYQSDILPEINTATYKITKPCGEVELVYGIRQWCKDNNKDGSRLLHRLNTKPSGSWYGYKIERLN